MTHCSPSDGFRQRLVSALTSIYLKNLGEFCNLAGSLRDKVVKIEMPFLHYYQIRINQYYKYLIVSSSSSNTKSRLQMIKKFTGVITRINIYRSYRQFHKRISPLCCSTFDIPRLYFSSSKNPILSDKLKKLNEYLASNKMQQFQLLMTEVDRDILGGNNNDDINTLYEYKLQRSKLSLLKNQELLNNPQILVQFIRFLIEIGKFFSENSNPLKGNQVTSILLKLLTQKQFMLKKFSGDNFAFLDLQIGMYFIKSKKYQEGKKWFENFKQKIPVLVDKNQISNQTQLLQYFKQLNINHSKGISDINAFKQAFRLIESWSGQKSGPVREMMKYITYNYARLEQQVNGIKSALRVHKFLQTLIEWNKDDLQCWLIIGNGYIQTEQLRQRGIQIINKLEIAAQLAKDIQIYEFILIIKIQGLFHFGKYMEAYQLNLKLGKIVQKRNNLTAVFYYLSKALMQYHISEYIKAKNSIKQALNRIKKLDKAHYTTKDFIQFQKSYITLSYVIEKHEHYPTKKILQQVRSEAIKLFAQVPTK